MCKIYNVDEHKFIEVVANNDSYSSVLRCLGLSTKGGYNSKRLKLRIKELNLSIDHFKDRTYFACKIIRKPLDSILVEKSTYLNLSSLKKRLLDEKLLNYSCSVCGISDWLGKPVSLQLDHINGVSDDHRITNIRLLCPNCHSQTDNYAGRNKKHLTHYP